jgi:hypothetical protein
MSVWLPASSTISAWKRWPMVRTARRRRTLRPPRRVSPGAAPEWCGCDERRGARPPVVRREAREAVNVVDRGAVVLREGTGASSGHIDRWCAHPLPPQGPAVPPRAPLSRGSAPPPAASAGRPRSAPSSPSLAQWFANRGLAAHDLAPQCKRRSSAAFGTTVASESMGRIVGRSAVTGRFDRGQTEHALRKMVALDLVRSATDAHSEAAEADSGGAPRGTGHRRRPASRGTGSHTRLRDVWQIFDTSNFVIDGCGAGTRRWLIRCTSVMTK